MVTPQEARDMRAAIEREDELDAISQRTQHDNNVNSALSSWYNTLNIRIDASTTRTKALDVFEQIRSLLTTETDIFRLIILRQKLAEANEKYKKVKKVNPHS